VLQEGNQNTNEEILETIAKLQHRNDGLVLKNETLEWQKSISQAQKVCCEMQVPQLQE
jgi:hypothetical protein